MNVEPMTPKVLRHLMARDLAPAVLRAAERNERIALEALRLFGGLGGIHLLLKLPSDPR